VWRRWRRPGPGSPDRVRCMVFGGWRRDWAVLTVSGRDGRDGRRTSRGKTGPTGGLSYGQRRRSARPVHGAIGGRGDGRPVVVVVGQDDVLPGVRVLCCRAIIASVVVPQQLSGPLAAGRSLLEVMALAVRGGCGIAARGRWRSGVAPPYGDVPLAKAFGATRVLGEPCGRVWPRRHCRGGGGFDRGVGEPSCRRWVGRSVRFVARGEQADTALGACIAVGPSKRVTRSREALRFAVPWRRSPTYRWRWFGCAGFGGGGARVLTDAGQGRGGRLRGAPPARAEARALHGARNLSPQRTQDGVVAIAQSSQKSRMGGLVSWLVWLCRRLCGVVFGGKVSGIV